MQAHKEQWQRLCEQIAIEEDPAQFTILLDELNKLLEEKERRLDQRREPDGVIPCCSTGDCSLAGIRPIFPLLGYVAVDHQHRYVSCHLSGGVSDPEYPEPRCKSYSSLTRRNHQIN